MSNDRLEKKAETRKNMSILRQGYSGVLQWLNKNEFGNKPSKIIELSSRNQAHKIYSFTERWIWIKLIWFTLTSDLFWGMKLILNIYISEKMKRIIKKVI